MSALEQHEMTRTRALEPGLDEWLCETCGRRMIMRRPPRFEKTVLEPGDETVMHTGSTGGFAPGAMTAEAFAVPLARRELPEHDRHWLEGHGMDWEA